MNKLKIFLTTFAICIMSVGFSFADSSVKSISTPKYKYYATFTYGSSDFIAYSNYEIYIDGDYLKCKGEWHKYYQDGTFISTVTNGADIAFIPAVKNVSIGNNGVVSPPQIAPTIQGAIQGIVPTFSKQLSQFLPKALIMFSMVLAVPLVPRVIRLFF